MANFLGANTRDIVQKVNGGAMLRGTYHRYDLKDFGTADDYSNPRSQLVELKDKFVPEITGLAIGAESKDFECLSEEEYEKFEQLMKKTDIYLGCNTQIIDASIGGRYKKETNQFTDQALRKTFYCCVRKVFVPIASVQLNSEDVKLTDTAYKALYTFCELRRQQGCNDGGPQREQMYKECDKFFEKFGTHLNVGLVHLGGILTRQSTFASSTTSSYSEVKRMVHSCLDASVVAPAALLAACARFSTDNLKGVEEFNRSDLASTSVSCSVYGGPLASDSIQGWINSLQNNSSSWVIVDTGNKTMNNQIGVWDLIRGSNGNEITIQNNDGVTVTYDKEKCMGTLYIFFKQWIYRKKIKLIISQLPDIPESSDYLETLENILMENNTRKERFTDFDENNSWYYLLKDDTMVASFLRKALEKEPRSNAILGKISLSINTLLTKHIGAGRAKNSFGEQHVLEVIKLQEKKEEEYKENAKEARNNILKEIDSGVNITDANTYLTSLRRLSEMVKEKLREDDWVSILQENDAKTTKRRSAYLLKPKQGLRPGIFAMKKDIKIINDAISDEIKQLIEYTGKNNFHDKEEIIGIWARRSAACHIM